MLTLIILAIWLYYGVKVVKQQPGIMMFLSMVAEQTPWRARIMMFAMAFIWPFFKFMK